MNAESLAKKLLASDQAILRVLVLGKTGEELAHVYSKAYPKRDRLGTETEKKFGELDTVTLAMFKQAESRYGTADFILLAFKNAKVMLMRSEKQGFYLAVRILRSANAEYLHTKLEPILNIK